MIEAVRGVGTPYDTKPAEISKPATQSNHSPMRISRITHVEHVSRGSDWAQSAVKPRYMMYLRLAGEA